MDLRKIIEKKRDSAKYMVEEITYICKKDIETYESIRWYYNK